MYERADENDLIRMRADKACMQLYEIVHGTCFSYYRLKRALTRVIQSTDSACES